MNLVETDTGKSFFGRSKLALALSLLVIFTLGLGIRLYDLTDPPMDFHPTRQIRSLIIARGMYYEMTPSLDHDLREKAISYWQSMVAREPQFLERFVALTYKLMGGEYLWVARLYTSLAWVFGGAVLFLLASRMVSIDGAVAGVAFYLFLPFGIIASRSFQPDPIMVLWFLLTALSLYRWSETRTWKWAILTGILGGIAVLAKIVAAYLVAGMAITGVLYLIGFRKGVKDAQVWTIGLLMIIPPAIYYLVGIRGTSSDFLLGSTLSLLHLIKTPSYYMRWMIFLQGLMGLGIIFIGLAGMMISRPLNRNLLLGLWAGYGLYGISFPHHIPTHEYYHLQLIPIVALSLAPIAGIVLSRIAIQKTIWHFLTLGLMVIGAAYPLWITRSVLKGQDFRQEAAFWLEVGRAIPEDGKTIALTQNYGHYLMYYGWKKVSLWPTTGEQKLSQLRGNEAEEFRMEYQERTEGQDFFLVTSMAQLESQPELKDTLYKGYPVFVEGNGYVIFDLQHPVRAP